MTSESENTRLSEDQIAAILKRVGPRATPSPEAEAAVRNEVRRAWRQSLAAQKQTRHRQWPLLAAAASVMLALGIALMLPDGPDVGPAAAQLVQRVNRLEYSPAGSDGWEVASADAEFLPGDRLRLAENSYAAITLSNGAALRLDEETELRFVSEDSLYLDRGAVYADAAGDSTLEVLTADGTARDIGTRFEVRVDDSGWRVQVREGRVVVQDYDAGTAFADAGERVIADGDGFVKEAVSPSDSSWSWTQAATLPMAIEGALLDDYLRWWSRESGVVVEFQSDMDLVIAGQTRLHGSLEGLSLEEGLRVVLSTSGYRVVASDDGQLTLAR